MEISITTLNENTAGVDNILAERGLSIHIDIDGFKVLFDTGAGGSTVHNAQLLGIDLTAVDVLVLSHGHADHTGGLLDVLKRSGPKRVIAHPSVWQRKYGPPRGGRERFIGIPFEREGLEALGASFELSREAVKLNEGVLTTGEVPLVTGYEEVDPELYIKEGAEQTPDKVPDDLSLVINTEFGLVVVLGCAHRGIINILLHARKLTGNELVYAVIGGTHLERASPERMEKTTSDLKEIGVQYLGLSHCTGFGASAYLSREFGGAFFLNNAGTRFTMPF